VKSRLDLDDGRAFSESEQGGARDGADYRGDIGWLVIVVVP